MLVNTLESFLESLFTFLTGQNPSVKGLLLKKHAENLWTHGEFSFPNSSKSWNEFISATCPDDTLLQSIGKTYEDLLEESKKWKIQVRKLREENGRIYLFLDRVGTISCGLADGLRNAKDISQRLKNGRDPRSIILVDPQCDESNCLSELRVKYLTKVLENLCSIQYCNEEKLGDMFVISKSSISGYGTRIPCGAVLNSKTGKKEMDINADEFIRSRQDEMTRIAQHKYGIRVTTDSKWREFIAHLGESAATFELLEVRPTSVVKINVDHMAGGSSKGAAFILYNCARLETIIRTYDDNVAKGIYPPLPDFDEVDFSLLTQEEEWILIFNYIMGFPSMLESCLDAKSDKFEFRPHFICGFLCSMVKLISQYYRKTRILVEPRSHLLPVIYARIHMLKVLNDTLKNSLRILNIRSVTQM